MKLQILNNAICRSTCLLIMLMTSGLIGFSQDTTAVTEETAVSEVKSTKGKPVKNTFESVWIIDNQTVIVPIKKTFQMDIMHRFGTVNNGYEDFWGFFAPSNIRLGVNYSPIDKLNLGIGITKSNMLWDASAKYSIISQTQGKSPVSVTYYGNVAYDTRKDEDGSLFRYNTDRFLFFNQLIIARKITDKLSLQVAPSVSHQNAVYGYYKNVDSAKRVVDGEMEHNHFAISFAGRYKLTNVTSILVNIDQPITKHTTNNPNPNISFGLEFGTGSHAFQLFLGNYSLLSPQRNNLYNSNNYKDSEFLIGFNITRLWNY
ncbi:MAG: DUF5777 family beta-barrel protein [Flavisolibacter sp.]